MLRARQAVFEQAADRIAVHRPVVGVAHVEMGVEGDQADLGERQAEPVRGRAGHRIVAAEQDGEIVTRGAGLDRQSRIGAKPSRRHQRLHRRRRRHRGRRDRARGPSTRSKVLNRFSARRTVAGREVAAARGHRARLHRRAEQRDRRGRIVGHEQVGDRFPAHPLPYTRASPRRRAMWDRLLVDCNIATMDPAVRRAVRGDREWRDRHPGRADRPGRPAHRAGRLSGEEGRAAATAPG